jgi:hypothetical protein
MGRIRDAFECKFRALLQQVGPRRVERGVRLLIDRAERLSARTGMPLARALAQVYERTAEQIGRRRSCPAGPQAARPTDPPSLDGRTPNVADVVFVCDAGLGGLARGLRAAGYEAHWRAEIGDDELLHEAHVVPATLLTTDSLLMERGVVRDGFIPAVWVPPTLTKWEQLALVLRELCLPLREPRCMTCGGELRSADKQSVRDRIPPRTYYWRDEYYLCTRCDKLFWHGTHWERIQQRIRGAVAEKGVGRALPPRPDRPAPSQGVEAPGRE